jgi:hypothetical protein
VSGYRPMRTTRCQNGVDVDGEGNVIQCDKVAGHDGTPYSCDRVRGVEWEIDEQGDEVLAV